MIDKNHELPVVRQAQLLELSRSSVYYRAPPTSESDLKLLRRIDELHLEHPFAGARMLRDMLKLEGYEVVQGFAMILLLRRTLTPKAQTSLFLAAFCIAMLILPYLIRTTQAAMEGIPEHMRLLGPCIGFSKWQNIRHVLLPIASRGIFSGIILAIGRASEDTAVILLTGVVAHAGIPRDLWDKFEALPFRIYYLAAEHRNSIELEQGFGTAIVLLCITGLLFLAAFFLQRRAEKRWRIR